MEEKKETTALKKRGGRNKKKPSELANKKVGGYWLTENQAAQYKQLFLESKHKTETDFFKEIIFEGKLKLYYSDENTKAIYLKIVEFTHEYKHLNKNINQITKRISAITDDKLIQQSQKELGKELLKIQDIHHSFYQFLEAFKPSKTL